ncbi:MAG: hypothetical protein K2P86_00265 [Xanthobacteraceae bacterium]|jgi:hypothetical protein|nr:hypothetical protein [Xanthobacteraceae bacterium]
MSRYYEVILIWLCTVLTIPVAISLALRIFADGPHAESGGQQLILDIAGHLLSLTLMWLVALCIRARFVS